MQFILVLLGELRCPYVAAKIQLPLEPECIQTCCVLRSVPCLSTPPNSFEISGFLLTLTEISEGLFFFSKKPPNPQNKQPPNKQTLPKPKKQASCDNKWLQKRWCPVSLEGWQWTSVGNLSQLLKEKFRMELWMLKVQHRSRGPEEITWKMRFQ